MRAARPIAKGGEATISYLGGDTFAPLRMRRAALAARYGFACACARCADEEAADKNLQARARARFFLCSPRCLSRLLGRR